MATPLPILAYLHGLGERKNNELLKPNQTPEVVSIVNLLHTTNQKFQNQRPIPDCRTSGHNRNFTGMLRCRLNTWRILVETEAPSEHHQFEKNASQPYHTTT